MEDQKLSGHSDYITLTNYALSVLRLPQQDIRDKFSDYPVCLMEYHEKEIYEKVIEIRFDPEKASFSCIFNEEKICDMVCLFFDNHLKIADYIQYLNENFTYDYLTSRWSISESKISIKRTEEVTCFVFQKLFP